MGTTASHDPGSAGTTTTARTRARRARPGPRAGRRASTAAESAPPAAVCVEDLPIADYDRRTAGEIVDRLPQLSQVELAKIEAYERARQRRRTVLERIAALHADLPWPGYDDQTAEEIRRALSHASPRQVETARRFERRHKGRKEVLEAAERQLERS